jgi:hypothetical protein
LKEGCLGPGTGLDLVVKGLPFKETNPALLAVGSHFIDRIIRVNLFFQRNT